MVKNAGFTLMEIAVTIGILAIVSVASVIIFYRSVQSGNKSDTVKIIDQNSQLVLNVMGKFIRSAKRVDAVGGGSCPATSNSITLLGSDGEDVQFTLDNGRVASNGSYISDPSVTISDLTFTCLSTPGSPDSITIDFTASASSQANDYQSNQAYSTTVVLRSFTSE